MLLTGNAIKDKELKTIFASGSSIDSQHQVMAEWNYNAYTPIEQIGCYYSDDSNVTFQKDTHYGTQAYYYSDDITELDTHRETYTPLKSIFEINRPKPGIIHSVYTKSFADKAINGEANAATSLSIANMFNMTKDHARLYPVSKDSIFKYWSSGRVLGQTTVGVSNARGLINYAAPYIEYSKAIFINKVAIKTQHHLGYPETFQIDVKTGTSSSSWKTIYENSDSLKLKDGELEIYYNSNKNNWTVYSRVIEEPDESAVINFNTTSSETVKIYGLRFIAKKMSKPHIPLEMIELSPRLVADLTSSTISFDVRSSLSNSSYGLPIGSVVSSNGSIKLSNENGYFSKNNPDSILKDILKPNVEFRLYQRLNIDKSFDISGNVSRNKDGVVTLTCPGHTFVGGDTVNVSGLTGVNVKMNGTWTVLDSGVTENTFKFNTNEKSVIKSNSVNTGTCKNNTKYRFPLKTLYSGIWNDQDDFTVDTQLEDYFKFFREQAAPDLMIANKNGIPTSCAMLIFMDNVGFNNFRFEKVDDTEYVDKEDIILDYFYSKKEQTIMEVIESLAISTQTAIYMDVDNELVAMTKEKMVQSQTVKDFWMVGDNESILRSSFYDGVDTTTIKYIANIESLQDTSEPPITDITVQYNGLGLEKKSVALVGANNNTKSQQETLERSDFGASTINKDLKYMSDIIWQPGQDQNAKDNSLGAAALLKNITETGPYSYLKSIGKNHIIDYTKESVIKTLVISPNDSIRARMSIYLDKSYINTFTSNFSGYILVDSELIKYYGISYLVSDPKNKSYYRDVYFSADEYKSALSKLSQGGSMEPEALIVDLDFTYEQSDNDNAKKQFTIVGDGRAQNKTEASAHKAVNTKSDFLQSNTDWHRCGVNLWGGLKSLDPNIIKNLTVSNRKETFLSNQTMNINLFQQSFNGHLRLSGPKCKKLIKSTKSYDASVKALIPTSDPSEQIITSIVKNVTNNAGKSVPVKKIGTRMRLINDVPKNVNAGDKTIETGVIAGIGWGIVESPTKTAMTGYFVEVEDVGTIDATSLSKAQYRNLRLYKIVYKNGKYVPDLLGNAWVNVSSTPNDFIDYAQKPSDEKSHSQIFDLEVDIRTVGGRRQYQVFWENQNVLTVSESNTKITNKTSSKICLFVRGQSSAIYENIYTYGSPDGINLAEKNEDLRSDYFYGIKNTFSRCYLPVGVTSMMGSDKKNHILYYEEFGRLVREVKRFDVRYSQAALKPKLITLAGLNTNYHVADFESSSNGATFWLYNTSNGPITIDDAQGTPLWISGFKLKQISSGAIQSSKLLEREDYSKALDDDYEANRKIYGKQELQLSGEFINNRAQAENIARWVITKLKKERITISLSIFPNPLLKLGDKVGIAYDAKFFNDSKSYTITSISHSISNSGPTMNIELKECV